MRFLHTGQNQPDKTAVCLESLRVFGEGRTFLDLPPERQAEGNHLCLVLRLCSRILFLFFDSGIQMDVDSGNHCKEEIPFVTVDLHIM